MNTQLIIDRLHRLNLSPNMYFFCFLLMKKNMNKIDKFKKLVKQYDVKPLTSKEIAELVRRKFLIKQPDNTYDVGDGFRSLFVDVHKAGLEFWNEYPSFINIKGKRVPLKAIDSGVLRQKYKNSIHSDAAVHMEVMDILRYAKKNDYTFPKIESFVSSEMWKDIKKEMDKKEERNEENTQFSNSITNDF